jgi:hypothetical protein
MLMLRFLLTFLTPVNSFTICWIFTTALIHTCVYPLVYIYQTQFTHCAPHISFINQFFVVLRWTLTKSNFRLNKLMSVSCVTTITLFTKCKVVTLLTIVSEMSLFNWLKTLWIVTNIPGLITLTFRTFISCLYNFLL